MVCSIRLSAAIFLALGLIVASVTEGALAADSDAQSAVKTHMECVANNASKMDDGQMDPKRLAELIQPHCHAEHEFAMQTASPEKWKATSEDWARKLELDHTIAAILFYRSRLKTSTP
jgi:hypothetical protein